MNLLLFEADALRRIPLLKSFLNCDNIHKVFVCKNEEEFERVLSSQAIDIIFSRFMCYFDSNLPSIRKKLQETTKVLAYLPNDLDRENRSFYQLSDHCYLTKFNPTVEDVMEDLMKVYHHKEVDLLTITNPKEVDVFLPKKYWLQNSICLQ